MAFNLGGFAGGLASGMQEGADLRKKYQEEVARQQALKAQAAAANAQMQPNVTPVPGVGQQPQPGGAQPPAQGAPPTPVPMPGATPMPQAQGAAPAPPQAQAPPPRLPTGAAPQMGGPPPGASPPSPGPGGGSPTPQGGGGQQQPQMPPQVQAAHQQLGSTVKDLYQQVLQANPDLKKHPQLAYQAVENIIAQNKEMDESEKVALRAYNDAAGQQLKLMEAQMKATQAAEALSEKKEADAAKVSVAREKISEALLQAKIAAQSRQTVGAGHDAAHIAGAQIGAQSREAVGAGHDAASEANENVRAVIKQYGIDAGMDEAEMKAAVGEETSNYRAQAGAAGQAGKPAPATPKSRATLKRPLAPSGGGQGTARNPTPVKTPEEAAALPPGTYFKTPDGQTRQRH